MTTYHVRPAIYIRTSSEHRAKQCGIASQVQAIEERIWGDGLKCDPEHVFFDEGYSGNSPVRPALERLRRRAAAGAVDRLYVLSADRLSRRCTDQARLVEEFARCRVEVIFLDNSVGQNFHGTSPREDDQQ
jgi:site-specific DNA recombinase